MPESPRPAAAGDYWSESRRPLVSLAFVAPILALYEAGVLFLGTKALRNGADVWLRRFLEALDFGHYFLLPLLTVAILLGWHYTARQPWSVRRDVVSRMFLESVLLAVGLRLLLQVEAVMLAGLGAVLAPAAAVGGGLRASLGNLVGFLGAGVYEELLFRLVLLSAAVWLLARWGFSATRGAVLAALVTSFVFAAAHYVGPYGDPIELGQFSFWFAALFRFLAGVFFSALFVCRGFGIVVGTHAAYDILAMLG